MTDRFDGPDLLTAVVQARNTAAELKDGAKALVADAVAEAMDAGISVARIAAELGVSRQRVYQLRDGD